MRNTRPGSRFPPAAFRGTTRARAAWLGLFLLLAVPSARPAGPGSETTEDEKLLAAAGVSADGPGLLAYLRAQTPSPSEQGRLRAAVRRLGDSSFPVRERASADLLAAGRRALPYLRPATTDPDLEVRRRARRCLEQIDGGPHAACPTAALRLLADRRPPGAAAVVLAYLPFAEDEAIEEAGFAALDAVGLPGGQPDPALTAALSDREPLRRAGAARVLGRSAAPARRRPVARLLADPAPRVRFEAAAALACAGDRAAVPALAALLEEAPAALAWQAEDLLFRIAGDRHPPQAVLGRADAEARRRCRAAWAAWWKGQGPGADLARMAREEAVRGLTLVCEFDGTAGGRVWEFGKDGKMRWEVTGLQGPNDVQLLPGGRVLVAERNGGQVSERDRRGKVLWAHATNGPIACQRLANGNTLVVNWTEMYEVTPAHKKVFSRPEPAGYRHAVKLRNGQVVYVTANGRVGVLDAGWKPVRTITPAAHANAAASWASVEPLPTGRYLLTLAGVNKVVEIDTTGKIVWEYRQNGAVFATRLGNGHTLIASFDDRCLVEVTRAGKEVARHPLRGRPFTVRRCY